MKLYMAIKDVVTLMDGRERIVLGVYDSKDKALKAFKKDPEFKCREPGTMYYHFDGELSYFFRVKEMTLNEFIK